MRYHARMSNYPFYGRPNSGSFAIQVALEEIGAPYERIWIPFESTDAADWRALNPTGKVPALALPDGTLVFESAAILTQWKRLPLLGEHARTFALRPAIIKVEDDHRG
jgi:GST-like protein